MNKKTATIILSAVIILLVAVGLYFYFIYTNKEGDGGKPKKQEPGTAFPQGEGEDDSDEKRGEGERDDENVTIASYPALRVIFKDPVSGSVAFEREEDQMVRFVERSKGNIFEASLSSLTPKRLTNKTIPKVGEALFAPTGESVILRYVDKETDTITSFSARIDSSTDREGENSLEGSFLSPDIRHLSLSPSGTDIFYTNSSPNGGAFGITAKTDGTSKVRVFASDLREWNYQWAHPTRILLFNKGGWGVRSSLYFLNPRSSKEERIGTPVEGLTALLSPSGEYLLYSSTEGARVRFWLYNVKEKKTSMVPFLTFADKCVWQGNKAYCAAPDDMPDGRFPDEWYQGLVSFNDKIWLFDAEEEKIEFIADLRELGRTSIDAIDLRISPDGKHLVFTNKNDYSLWNLQMEE